MRFILGLTGSIGMGKSTTSVMFAKAGCAVWDADAVVHGFYAPGGAAVDVVQALFPKVIDNNQVSRSRLRDLIAADPSVLDQLQQAVHPLVAADRQDFIASHPDDIIVLDIPLLFETGADTHCDAVVVVSVDPVTQKQRVMDRGEMSEDDFAMILARQTPDAEKRARADYLIVTDTLDNARAQVQKILNDIRGKLNNA